MRDNYTPEQVRMAQNLAVELRHIGKGVPSLIGLYDSAPELLEFARYALKYINGETGEHLNGQDADVTFYYYAREVISKASGKRACQRRTP